MRCRLLPRLVVFSAVSTAVALLLFAVYLGYEQKNQEQSSVGNDIQVLADDVGNAVVPYLALEQYPALESVLRQTAINRDILLLQVVGTDGRLRGQVRRDGVGMEAQFDAPDQLLAIPRDPSPRLDISGEHVEAWRPIEAEKRVGWVRVVKRLSESGRLESHLWRDFFLVFLPMVGISAFVTWMLLRRPMTMLSQAAEFATQLPRNEGRQLEICTNIHEFSALSTALNDASRHLKEQEQALRHSRHREASRSQVYAAMAMGQPLPQVLERIVTSIEQEAPGTLASVLILDRVTQRLVHGASPSLPEPYSKALDGLPIGEGVGSCGSAAYLNRQVIVEDIFTHPYWSKFHDLALLGGVASCWSEPIRDAEGQVLGTFAIYHRHPAVPTKADLELIHQAAYLASLALERQHAQEALQQAASVYEASGEGIVVTDQDNLIIAVNPAFTRLTGYAADEVIGKSPSILSSGSMDSGFYRSMWRSLKAGGQWQGEIWNKRKDGTLFAEWLTINVIHDEVGKVYRYVGVFSDISEKKKAEETIWQQANYDQLTGLPNRRLFCDRLEQDLRRAERDGSMLAVMFVDLDRFKNVNDTMGHGAGDQLLIEAARRLERGLRESDMVARLASDEFAVALTQVTDPGAVDRVAQSLLQSLAEPYTLSDGPAYLSASIGITLFPSDGGDTETLLLNSARAMNAAKQHGANSFSWYTLELQVAAQVRSDLGRDLRAALTEDQFRVYYQPIIDMASGRIVKAEALIRWQHPERGLVGPMTFIPLAEDLGLIGEMGDWVFRTVARQARHWLDRGIDLQYSVNKSPRQFGTTDNLASWLAFLEEIDLPASKLVVEITEGLLLDARSDVIEQLAQLRSAGIQIAIDDFGTGYSALSYLQQFDIDYLKIDRSFVKDLDDNVNDRALADAIVVMAHKLGIKVIAEGVETEFQRDWLQQARCDYVQGYFYARPLPPDEFESLVERVNGTLPLRA
ncbi:MAG TPA: EAL domain-containing protein [Rhodocyclaceae bacterium]|nr:EAL domain-containing protein [Rhodocyclaceae bacterium]